MNRITRWATLRIMLAIGLIAFLGASLLILPSGMTEAQAHDYDLPAAGGAHFYTHTMAARPGPVSPSVTPMASPSGTSSNRSVESRPSASR